MKRKNVILLLCDALSNNEDLYKDMPQLLKYKDNTISFSNYWSHAPYTEAAIVPIFSASNVLDYGGYLHNLKNKPLNMNEVFGLLGYKTYNTIFFYSNTYSFLRGVDEYDYIGTTNITYYIYKYRIKYYQDLYKKDKLSFIHLNQIKTLLDDLFEMIDVYIDDYNNRNYRLDLLMKYTTFKDYDFNGFTKEADANKKYYFQNKEKYIEELLKNNNTFLTGDSFQVTKSNNYKENEKKLNEFIKNLSYRQVIYSLARGFKSRSLITLKDTIKHLKSNKDKVAVLKAWTIKTNNFPFKYTFNYFSAKLLLDRVYDYLEVNRNNDNFIFCHLVDSHYPGNFLSYELDVVDEEINKLTNGKKNIVKNQNNFYKFTKAYLDKQIVKFIDNLKASGQLDDTTIIITSDHGSSYLGEIERIEGKPTFYDENYKIPLLIIDKQIEGYNIDNYASNKQLLPTILDYLKFGQDDEWVQKNSIFRNNKDYIISEYYGPGVPDVSRLPKLFSIRSNNYKINYNIAADNNKGEVIAIYDLQADKKELKNIKYRQSNPEVIALFEKLLERIRLLK